MSNDADRKTSPHGLSTVLSTYWRRTRNLTLYLLLIWFVLTFVIIFFARELSGFSLFGWPISFYMAAQGATLIYVVIVGFYAWTMERLDKTLTVHDTDGK